MLPATLLATRLLVTLIVTPLATHPETLIVILIETLLKNSIEQWGTKSSIMQRKRSNTTDNRLVVAEAIGTTGTRENEPSTAHTASYPSKTKKSIKNNANISEPKT